MRKIYKMAGIACLGLLLSTINSKAQTVSDFENLTLAPNSFWDGGDLSGIHSNSLFSSSFTSGDVIFPNVFDTTFGMPGIWGQGFAYSNMTDSVTSGFGNLHSARTASGVNGSSNYVVGVKDAFNGVEPVIHLTGAAVNNTVSGVYITNGTYAANSMRDGDAFAKKFGGATGNDPDWFKLTIWGFHINLPPDSIEFYLADYRFTNNAQDYIVTNWQWIDLTSLGLVDSIMFVLSSSDNGAFGMNTPPYFCLDNFNDQSVSINELEKDNLHFTSYPNPVKDNVYIDLDANIRNISIIDVTGKTVLSENNLKAGIHHFDLSNIKNGVYFIKAIADNNIKIEKIIKE